MKFMCPVCGYALLEDEPRSQEGGGSYEICPSCGFQFGVSDEDEGFSYDQWRKQWIEDGMRWYSRGITPPPGWNPTEQLHNLKKKGSES